MSKFSKIKSQKRLRRHRRTRAKIKGTAKKPRLSVFRSNKYIYAQVIDDELGVTLAHAGDLNIKKKETPKAEKTEVGEGKIAKAYEIGQIIAKRAGEKGIKEVVFDRGGYRYFGRIKAVAEGARKGGLKF